MERALQYKSEERDGKVENRLSLGKLKLHLEHCKRIGIAF